MTKAELRPLVTLCRHDREDVARRAFGILCAEFQRLIDVQDVENYRAFCDLVFALDYPLFTSVLCEVSHYRQRE